MGSVASQVQVIIDSAKDYVKDELIGADKTEEANALAKQLQLMLDVLDHLQKCVAMCLEGDLRLKALATEVKAATIKSGVASKEALDKAGGVKGGVTPQLLDSKTKELIATNLEENPMDFEAFWAWFVEAFGDGEGDAKSGM